jgi:hypothetical protein
LLPHKELVPHYDKVTWLFVTRNFKEDDKDREARRTHDRFGISSWPHLVLFDPREDRVLSWMSRQIGPFKKQLLQHADAVPKPGPGPLAKWKQLQSQLAGLAQDKPNAAALESLRALARDEDPLDVWLAAREWLRKLDPAERSIELRLQDPDVRERAIAVEELALLEDDAAKRWTEAVTARLFDEAEHLIVRIRALRFLESREPQAISQRAEPLLRIPSDELRYSVMKLLVQHPNAKVAPVLTEIFAGAGRKVPSNNPNVLRSHAARALSRCGDAAAIPALAAFLKEVMPNNGTQKTTVEALVGIASRVNADARAKIQTALLEGIPGGVDDPRYARFRPDWIERRLVFIVAYFRDALSEISGVKELPKIGKRWNEELRLDYLKRLRAALKQR